MTKQQGESRMTEHNTQTRTEDRVLILETTFYKVHTKGTYVIITDKDDGNAVVLDINELGSIYNIIYNKE